MRKKRRRAHHHKRLRALRRKFFRFHEKMRETSISVLKLGAHMTQLAEEVKKLSGVAVTRLTSPAAE